MKIIRLILLTVLMSFVGVSYSESQIIAPAGVSTRASSQLIYHFNQIGGAGDTVIQVTNTNDTEGVWIHVQFFRSLDPNDPGAPIVCDERDFVDFLTPNDTHVYDLDAANFPRNIGETATSGGGATTIDLDPGGAANASIGFAIITPVVSDVDFTAISFQHMFGNSMDDTGPGGNYLLDALGRDALNFATGEVEPDGTPLDGTTNGFVVLQPEELFFNYATDLDGGAVDIIGIAFQDSYGPAGLLGYNITPGEVTWTPFIFDFRENPTSCGSRAVNCFLNVGLNDTLIHLTRELLDDQGAPGDLLCGGTIIPEYDTDGNTSFTEPDFFGWTRMFVSGYGDLENHIGIYINNDIDGAEIINTKGERTDTGPPPENCAVAGDEDGDGNADCADPDCVGLAGPSGETCEAAEATCDDGFDNDGDGATDGADTDCDGSESCPSCESGDQCSDGEDNDGDGNSDCADGGCDGATGPNGETCEAGVELTCNDNQDNDGDGTADCDDPDCAIATNCISGDGGGGGGGCSVASTASPSMLNFLLPLIVVGLVIGVRRQRKK